MILYSHAVAIRMILSFHWFQWFILGFFQLFSWYMNIQIILAENLEKSAFVGFCLQPLNLCAFFQPEPCGEVLSMLSIPLKSISERFMSTFEDWVKPFETWKSQSLLTGFNHVFSIFSCTKFHHPYFEVIILPWRFGKAACEVHSAVCIQEVVWPGHLCSWSSWCTFWKDKSIERIVKDNFEHNHLIETWPKMKQILDEIRVLFSEHVHKQQCWGDAQCPRESLQSRATGWPPWWNDTYGSCDHQGEVRWTRRFLSEPTKPLHRWTFFLWYCGTPEAVFLERARKKKGFTLLWWLGFVTHRLAQTQSRWAGACKHLQVATLLAKASINWTHVKHWNIIEYIVRLEWEGPICHIILYEYSTFGCNLLVYVSKKRIGFLGPLSWCPFGTCQASACRASQNQMTRSWATVWLHSMSSLKGFHAWLKEKSPLASHQSILPRMTCSMHLDAIPFFSTVNVHWNPEIRGWRLKSKVAGHMIWSTLAGEASLFFVTPVYHGFTSCYLLIV